MKLRWQSKLILLAVMPAIAAGLVLSGHWWAMHLWPVAVWGTGTSLLLAAVALRLGAVTPWAAATGAALTASLIFSTATAPYRPWQTALVPLVAVALLAHLATRFGGGDKRRLVLAELPHGRAASQIAANLGLAALLASEPAAGWLSDSNLFWHNGRLLSPALIAALAALAEAAADTVSSELGQAWAAETRLITTLRPAAPGTNGAISLPGTLAGALAGATIAALGSLALGGGFFLFFFALAGALFGLLFDSLLGATLEDRGWLNNDAVNFLSTLAAAALALLLAAVF